MDLKVGQKVVCVRSGYLLGMKGKIVDIQRYYCLIRLNKHPYHVQLENGERFWLRKYDFVSDGNED